MNAAVKLPTPSAAMFAKGERAAFFAPKLDWMPRNEQLSLALGKAQIAARILDDHRIGILSAVISGDTALLKLAKAPTGELVHGSHLVDVGEVSYGRAMLGDGEHAVLVEWALGWKS